MSSTCGVAATTASTAGATGWTGGRAVRWWWSRPNAGGWSPAPPSTPRLPQPEPGPLGARRVEGRQDRQSHAEVALNMTEHEGSFGFRGFHAWHRVTGALDPGGPLA